MIYVTAIPHSKVTEMQRTTFVCRSCNQTRSYMLAAAMAAVYAAASGHAAIDSAAAGLI
jgi:hypothetical protein